LITRGKSESRAGSIWANVRAWLKFGEPASMLILFAPLFVLVFLGLFRWINLQPQLFGANLPIIGAILTIGSTTALVLTVKAPVLLRRTRVPGILMLVSPFLKTSMWESEELAGVMRKSWELMTKHLAFIQTLSWTQNYVLDRPNFTMSEAISLILKLLPPVEKHSASCTGCK
jgi:hypothetical protein